MLERSHLPPEDWTWRTWMMQAAYRLMRAGESFEAYVELEPGWEDALGDAFERHGFERGSGKRLMVAMTTSMCVESVPAGVQWYLLRKLDDEDDAPSAYVYICANVGRMLDNGDDFEARYEMRDLYGIRERSWDDRCTFAEFNAWFWDRGRTRPYPVPRHGRGTNQLLDDLVTWATLASPENAETVGRFVGGFKAGSIPVDDVRAMRQISEGIDRRKLFVNPDRETSHYRQHLMVNRIHGLLDSIVHLERTDVPLL